MKKMIRKSIKVFRAELGLTQKEFANEIRMPFTTYIKKEKGISKFTLDEAYLISKIYKKDIEYIFFRFE